MMQLEILFCD